MMEIFDELGVRKKLTSKSLMYQPYMQIAIGKKTLNGKILMNCKNSSNSSIFYPIKNLHCTVAIVCPKICKI